MNFYLSYGAGVGSETLRLWLIEHDWQHEAVYVDHGCDWPETQEFVKTVPNLTVIKPDVQGFANLYEYCVYKKWVPTMFARWCTDKFKIRPLMAYFKRPCIVYLGITADEQKRVKMSKEKEAFNHYPLVAMGMTRQDCIDYIQERTGNVPSRSRCWFCPFMDKGSWKLLRKIHPYLYQKAKELEARNMEFRKESGKDPLTLNQAGCLEDITGENQYSLW